MTIRLIAWGLCLEGSRVLVQSREGETFYRLPGGGIEDGETAAQALARELIEEYGLEIEVGDLCSTFENGYEVDGHARCELVLIHRFRCSLGGAREIRHREHPDILLSHQDLMTLAQSRTAPPGLAQFAVAPPTHLVERPSGRP